MDTYINMKPKLPIVYVNKDIKKYIFKNDEYIQPKYIPKDEKYIETQYNIKDFIDSKTKKVNMKYTNNITKNMSKTELNRLYSAIQRDGNRSPEYTHLRKIILAKMIYNASTHNSILLKKYYKNLPKDVLFNIFSFVMVTVDDKKDIFWRCNGDILFFSNVRLVREYFHKNSDEKIVINWKKYMSTKDENILVHMEAIQIPVNTLYKLKHKFEQYYIIGYYSSYKNNQAFL